MNQKQMFLNCQIKQSTGDERIVSGYTSTWGLDSGRDKIKVRAFEESIKQRFQNQKDRGMPPKIKVLYQHDPKNPVGIPTVLREDPKGLYFEAKISKTRLGDEVLEMVKDGTISSMSIGFVVLKDEYDSKEDIRYIEEVKLVEFSFVTFPMNEEAMITGWKNSMEQLYSVESDIDKKIKEAVEKELKEKMNSPSLTTTYSSGPMAEWVVSTTSSSTLGVCSKTSVVDKKECPECTPEDPVCPDCGQEIEPTCPTCRQVIPECPCCGQTMDSSAMDAMEGPKESEDSYEDSSLIDTKNAINIELKRLGLDKYFEEEYIEKVGRAISRTNEQMLRDIVQALAPLKALLDSLETEEVPPSSVEEATPQSVVVEELAPVEPAPSTPPTIEASPEPVPESADTLLQDLQNVDWAALLASTTESDN